MGLGPWNTGPSFYHSSSSLLIHSSIRLNSPVAPSSNEFRNEKKLGFLLLAPILCIPNNPKLRCPHSGVTRIDQLQQHGTCPLQDDHYHGSCKGTWASICVQYSPSKASTTTERGHVPTSHPHCDLAG